MNSFKLFLKEFKNKIIGIFLFLVGLVALGVGVSYAPPLYANKSVRIEYRVVEVTPTPNSTILYVDILVHNKSIYHLEGLDLNISCNDKTDPNKTYIDKAYVPTKMYKNSSKVFNNSYIDVKYQDVTNFNISISNVKHMSLYKTYSDWFMVMFSVPTIFILCYFIHMFIIRWDLDDIKVSNLYAIFSSFIFAAIIITSMLVIGIQQGFTWFTLLLSFIDFLICFISVYLIRLTTRFVQYLVRVNRYKKISDPKKYWTNSRSLEELEKLSKMDLIEITYWKDIQYDGIYYLDKDELIEYILHPNHKIYKKHHRVED